MKENVIKQKSKIFAVRVVKLYRHLLEKKNEYIMSKQLMRSGTAIGALISESEYAETKKDFIHKMAVAQKEANETIYWLDLLKDTDYLTQEEFESINNDATEMLKLITSIIKTSKQSLIIKH